MGGCQTDYRATMTKRKFATASLLLILFVFAVLLGLGIYRQTTLDASSREFALFITPLILSANPDAPEIAEEDEAENQVIIKAIEAELAWELHAHPTLLKQQSQADRTKYLFVVENRLGVLELIQSISGSSEVPFNPFNNKPLMANYTLSVEFSDGTAEVELALLYEQGKWLISRFQVISNEMSD